MKYLVFLLIAALFASSAAVAADPVRVLYLTKSSGFEHSVIKLQDNDTSHSGRVLKKLAEENNFELTCSKDASLINEKDLEKFDVVIFYTSGDLTQTGTDKFPPMGKNGVRELLDWIEAGNGFVALHAGNDTFRGGDKGPTPFSEMVCGEFAGHGKQFKGHLQITDPDHPAMEGVPMDYAPIEEWYTFCNLNKEKMRVLALLNPGRERKRQKMYNIPSYPMIWCRALGEGRVYYNGLGHREDVWLNPAYQKMLINAIAWASGEGPANAEPNYSEAVPETIEASEKSWEQYEKKLTK
jgi:uncharacterized protein